MDPALTGYIRHRIARMEETIEKTRENASSLSPFSPLYASAPYYEKAGILPLLESLHGDTPAHEELRAEFTRCSALLDQMAEELGTSYRAALLDELRAYTAAYHAAVCHENLCVIGFEADRDLYYRDRISVLMAELERDHDLAGFRHLVCMMDRNHAGTASPGRVMEPPSRAAPTDTRYSSSNSRIPI